MKTKWVAVMGVGLVLLPGIAWAQEEGSGEGPERPGWGPGFSGGFGSGGPCTNQTANGLNEANETFEARLVLLPTENARSNAFGLAKLEVESQNGTQVATLTLGVFGLDNGDYTVDAVKSSDGSSVTLGQLTVNVSSDQNPGSHHQHGPTAPPGNGGTRPPGGPGPGVPAGHLAIQLPTDLDPTDVAQIVVLDANDTEMLVGTVSHTSSQLTYQLKVNVTAGPGAPHAQGRATLQSSAWRGKSSSQVSLSLSSVPANSTFNVKLNGQWAAQAKSGPKGNLVLKALPAKTTAVTSLTLSDARGRMVVAAKF